MNRAVLLKRIAKSINATRYLEIGVQRGHTFSKMDFPVKVGVDPDKRSAATVHMGSDNYFATLDPDTKFDLIFIDGLQPCRPSCPGCGKRIEAFVGRRRDRLPRLRPTNKNQWDAPTMRRCVVW